ncbi:MAG: HAMP domain-containing sensor histidine kinase [Nitrospirota bacterium]|nr:HAMP domain-containing sensor histidine kinase [Nitrospirota bacterium]
MRNKLFLSFVAVVLLALISGFIYERLITRDFEDYVRGAREDRLYWIMASVEGSYADGRWDHAALHETLHWAIMLGFDLQIEDSGNHEVMNSTAVITMLSPSMKKRMLAITDLNSATGAYEPYPLYQEGKEIGVMKVRQLSRPGVEEKEMIFKKRGVYFLAVAFAIAGGGAVLLSLFFSLFFSRPLNKMKDAVEALAVSDFSARVPVYSGDELGQLGRSFNYMAEALQREEALRRHLTSNIAHELRTPLAVMKANIEAMNDNIITDHALGLENIRAETENLIRLVQGIEDVTKAEASFFTKKNLVLFDLKEFLLQIRDRMLPLAVEKGLDIRVSGSAETIVMSDQEKLERIVQNILSNALKYTDKGFISIDFGKDNKGFFIEVADTGRGIARERLKDIFKRFYRGEESNGIGLGLAIVKELVEAMAGTIEVKSQAGEGSLFRIWLPENREA